MTPQTASEKILSAHCGAPARAGEIVICRVDWVIGTDGSGPMAIDYFEQMGGRALFDPSRVFFSLDHYAPPDWACNTFRALYDGLENLEKHTHQHVHQENNVLFPRALALQ